MPGLNYIHRFNGPISARKKAVKAALAGMGLEGDPARTVLETDHFMLSYKGYPGYPVAFWENGHYFFYLEGRLYDTNRKQTASMLEIIAEDIFRKDGKTANLTSWSLDRDGEYLIWLGEKKTGRTAIVNDILGRLPVYYCQRPDEVLISRDPRFIHSLSDQVHIDRLGLAQHLFLGHALGDGTIWRDVHFLEPGSLLLTNASEGRMTVKRYHTFNFDVMENRGVSLAENVSNLTEIFRQACDVRAGLTGVDVVSLSGGMDSRTVAAGLAAAGRLFSSATLSKSAYITESEARTAQKIAAVFNSPWDYVRLPRVNNRDALELLRLKSGVNTLGLSFILTFFKHIKEVFGSEVTYFTGDGGGFTMRDRRPARSLNSLSALVDQVYNYEYYQNFPLKLEDAATLTGFPARDLMESLTAHVSSYPEQNFLKRLVHYQIYGEMARIFNEGEDRNRCYFWSTAPLMSMRFFKYAMNCPDEQKAKDTLYRHLIYRLSPEAYAIEYNLPGRRLGSPRLRINYFIYKQKEARPHLVKRLKNLLKGEDTFSAQDEIIRLIKRQVENCPAIQEVLDPDHLNFVLNPAAYYPKTTILNLFTVVSAIEEQTCHRSSLEDHPEAFLY